MLHPSFASNGAKSTDWTAAPLHVGLLGGFRVTRAEVPLPDSAWQRRSAKTLTKLLATRASHTLHRDQVLEILWPDVDVECAAVERALVNVVDNACRAAGPGGRVRIEVEGVSDGSAIITVDDDGPGFGVIGEARAGMGLEVIRHVLAPLGGSLEISTHGPLGGASVLLHLTPSSRRPIPGDAP